jgi:Spy/CpxP family protein refolding chaperone
MKRYAVALALVVMASAAPAAAAPNPNPNAPAHAGTGCANVLSRNPNTGPGGHISEQGGTHFSAVGAALCGLE